MRNTSENDQSVENGRTDAVRMIHKTLRSGQQATGSGRKHAARMIYESVGSGRHGGRKYGGNV